MKRAKRARSTYRAGHVGRLRVRAAALLRASLPDLDVRPEDIVPATGCWRTDARFDVYRWELFTRLVRRGTGGQEIPVVAGCWDTLTRFVRQAAKAGCRLTEDREIYANETTRPPGG